MADQAEQAQQAERAERGEPALPETSEAAPPAARANFWNGWWAQEILPLATSVLLHVGIIVIGLLTAVAYSRYVPQKKAQIIIPSEVIVENAAVGGIPNPGLGSDPTREAAQDQFADVVTAANSWAERPSQSLTNSLMGGGSGEGTSDSVIGVGSGKHSGSGGGIGSGKGAAAGSGAGENAGGAIAPFGVPGGGGGIGPKSPFMGISGNARIVAYVCDASGSMISQFDLLRYEIRKAVDSLKAVQAFDVIFFQEDSSVDAGNGILLMANPDNKRRTYQFLNKVECRPQSDPIPGLQLAFKLKPQLIYLLTDGDFPDNPAVLAELRKLNAAKTVKINTIAFARPDDKDKEYVKVLQTIAQEHGGQFKFVTAEELGG
jgi:hypothetical protein